MKEKKCSKCNEVKLISEFRRNGNYWMGRCKPCQYEYTKIHNQKNKDKYRPYRKKSSKMCYDRGQTFMNKHRAIYGCQKCGEKRYWVIDYHHINPKEKNFQVTYYKAYKITKLKEEIRKCIPLCRNCHMDFHYLEKKDGVSIEEYVHLNKIK